MTAALLRLAACSLSLVLTLGLTAVAAEPEGAGGAVAVEDDGLIEFTSKEGGFSVRLPKKPAHEKTTVGEVRAEQHQFLVEIGGGAYMVAYQDNPNIEDGQKGLQLGLAKARRNLEETFKGEMLEVKEVTLEEVYPGISVRMTVPAVRGEMHCMIYLVGTRLYQILVLGPPEFTRSDEATRVMESFKLVK